MTVERPKVIETTALGAAYLAGLAVGFYHINELKQNGQVERSFEPTMEVSLREKKYKGWQKAVSRAMNWEE